MANNNSKISFIWLKPRRLHIFLLISLFIAFTRSRKSLKKQTYNAFSFTPVSIGGKETRRREWTCHWSLNLRLTEDCRTNSKLLANSQIFAQLHWLISTSHALSPRERKKNIHRDTNVVTWVTFTSDNARIKIWVNLRCDMIAFDRGNKLSPENGEFITCELNFRIKATDLERMRRKRSSCVKPKLNAIYNFNVSKSP